MRREQLEDAALRSSLLRAEVNSSLAFTSSISIEDKGQLQSGVKLLGVRSSKASGDKILRAFFSNLAWGEIYPLAAGSEDDV